MMLRPSIMTGVCDMIKPIMLRLNPGPARGLVAGLALMVVFAAFPGFAGEAKPPTALNTPYLAGQLLVATQKIKDPRFAKTVIYMVRHDKTGALGLIVNRVYGSGPMEEFLKGFNIDAAGTGGDIQLHYGGPVAPEAGFILHTADYNGPGTHVVDDRMAMTTERSVLKAISEGHGPRLSLFAFGYAGWGAGQLEGEIKRGDWFSTPADEELIFGEDQNGKWDRASGKAGLKL